MTALVEEAPSQRETRQRTQIEDKARLARQNPLAMVGLGIIVLFVLVAIFAPLVATHDPIQIDTRVRLARPSAEFILGTDELGRDIYSRLVWGARISLQVGVIVVAVAGTLGTLLGVTAGYLRGTFDEILMRLMDIILAFPSLVLAMMVAATLGPSLNNLMLAVAFVQIPTYVRVVRSEALLVREMLYVTAAESAGASQVRIVLRHILPNVLSPVIVLATLGVGQAILTAASLSFIGLGAQPPTSEWGAMISTGRKYILDAWWYPTFPGLSIFMVVMAFNIFGDGIRDVFDPRLRR